MMYTKLNKRIISLALCLAMIIAYIPVSVSAATPLHSGEIVGTVADVGTAETWETMMGH